MKTAFPNMGEKNEIDIKRISQPILLKMPEFYNNKCKVNISKQDANKWAKNNSGSRYYVFRSTL